MKTVEHTSLKEKALESLHKKGLMIAGPCSAETEEQLITTAVELASSKKVDVLRAGIWKPRTNPGGFEGAGTKALAWLLKASQLTQLPTAVEVASTRHVEDALSFDVNMLWIGARTTVNPFSVQQIADALKGTDSIVLIKNPVNADIKLWIGAVERLQKAGINKLGLIHRGFTSYGVTEYRNAPMWQIPIEMKRLFPELPMICDPSHICGKRSTILKIAQKSIDLDYDGLIIESHIEPQKALTDKEQQLTPHELIEVINNLVQRKAATEENNFVSQLELLREKIDQYDAELLNLIAGRMKIAKEIGELKNKSNVTILQSNRYKQIMERSLAEGIRLGLSEKFISIHLENLHMESIRIQDN